MRQYSSTPSRQTSLAEARTRLEHFVRKAAQVTVHAQRRGDGPFYYKLAIQRLALCHCLLAENDRRAIGELARALQDFNTSLEFGTLTESDDVSRFFYCGLIAHDFAACHFLATLAPQIWWPGEVYARWEAFFGFALLRGEHDRAVRILEFLEEICLEDADPDRPGRAKLLAASWHLMTAIHRRDTDSALRHVRQRLDLWPESLTQEQSHDCLYLYDLTALGFLRLAGMRGMDVRIEHPNLPIALLEAGNPNQPGG